MIIIPGTSLPTLSNPATAADLKNGKQLIDSNGNVLTGSMPTPTQATPSITVSSGGLITATSIQEAGYLAGGTKNATKQLTTQAGTTITPGTTQKTACASGRYTTGNIYVAGDSDLKAENIKAGVNIFGVTGSLQESKLYIMELTSGNMSSSGMSGQNYIYRIPFTSQIPSDASTSWEIVSFCIMMSDGGNVTSVFGGVGLGDGGLYSGGNTYAQSFVSIYSRSQLQVELNQYFSYGSNIYIEPGSHIVICPDVVWPV